MSPESQKGKEPFIVTFVHSSLDDSELADRAHAMPFHYPMSFSTLLSAIDDDELDRFHDHNQMVDPGSTNFTGPYLPSPKNNLFGLLILPSLSRLRAVFLLYFSVYLASLSILFTHLRFLMMNLCHFYMMTY